MAVSSTQNTVSYSGNGTSTAFAVTFPFLQSSDLVVTLVTNSSGAEAVQTLGTDYSVSGAGGSSGTVTMTSAPATGKTLRIERTVTLTQASSFRTQGSFSPAVHENSFDKLTMAAQQLDRVLDETIGDLAALDSRVGTLEVGNIALFTGLINVADYGSTGTALVSAAAAAVAAGKGLLIPSEITITSPVGTISSTCWFVSSGALNLQAGGSVTLTGGLQAHVLRQIFKMNGGTLTFNSTVSEVYPQWWGALGNGSADDTISIQNTINALSSGSGSVLFPPGTYKVTDTISISQNEVHVRGVGRGASTILFVPTSAKSCFKFFKVGLTIDRCTLSNLRFNSTDTTYKKVAVELRDISDMHVHDINVFTFSGAQSVGIKILGREVSKLDKLTIFADIPIQLSVNPNSGISCNELKFSNTYLRCVDNTQACVLVDDAVYISGMIWEGFNSWVGGKYGFYWNNTTGADSSFPLIFRNIWKEQGPDATGYTFYISQTGGGSPNAKQLIFDGVTADSACKGFYLRGVRYVTWNNCLYPSNNKEALNVDSTVINMTMNQFFAEDGSTATLTGQTLRGSFLKASAASPFPDVAWYQSSGASARAQLGPTEFSGTGTLVQLDATSGTAPITISDGTVSFNVTQVSSQTRIGNSSNHALQFGTNNSTRWEVQAGGSFAPITDNIYSLGDGTHRPTVIYAANGTINTSDAREKTLVRTLTTAEVEAAKALAKEIGAYKFLSAVSAKGDKAREHIGMTVQRAIEIMQSFGLNPFGYAFICRDTWKESVDPDTGVVTPAGDRFGFRTDQLLMFVAQGFEARLAALEARS